MKHKNNRGFTLIELLAVIVIMGILMMVAIPAMSKVIENSRKDTFIETAQTYTNAVNTLWKADSLYCGSENKAPSTMKEGVYYVLIDSTNTELVERGGKSSWGNKDVKG